MEDIRHRARRLLAGAIAAAALGQGAVAGNIVVNNASDAFMAGNGACTLREAIMNANANGQVTGGDCAAGSGTDTICFSIPGAGPHTISTMGLPDLTNPVMIDGFSEPGSMMNTNPLGMAINAVLMIEINGAPAMMGNDGLRIMPGAAGSTIRGLAINRFQRNGIRIVNSSNNVIRGCFLGTNVAGTMDLGNGANGVALDGSSSNNLIGGPLPAHRNLISGNGLHGVRVGIDPEALALTFRGDPMVPNEPNRDPLELFGTDMHPLALLTLATDNQIAGNFIGTNVTGMGCLGNSDTGVFLGAGAHGNVVGTDGNGTGDAGEGNLISCNGDDGVDIDGSPGNKVAGNRIGTNRTAMAGLGNGEEGVAVSDSDGNVIGTDGDGVSNALEWNVISDNEASGVELENAHDNTVAGNRIGTNGPGTACLGNGEDGVRLAESATGNRIGTNGDGVSDDLEMNLISCNLENGVQLVGPDIDQMLSLVAGEGPGGKHAAGPPGVPVAAPGSRGAPAGDDDADEPDEPAAPALPAALLGPPITNNVIAGNFIGTDLAGTACLGNLDNGVHLGEDSGENVVGTNGDGMGDAAEGNLISCNVQDGVRVQASNGNTIAGNLIGTSVAGDACLGNGDDGVELDEGSSTNVVGTDGNTISDAAERNVISCNGDEGVVVEDEGTDGNVVAGNLIGTDLACQNALPNVDDGVDFEDGAQSNRAGTNGDGLSDDLEANVISGNGNDGVEIGSGGDGTDCNVVAGNFIGTDETGMNPIPNGGDGVEIDGGARFNRIGSDCDGMNDAAEGNVIAFNLGIGVVVRDADTIDNSILRNSIFSNGALGIDLGGDGPTPNDPLDNDPGPNRLRNSPQFIEVDAFGNATFLYHGAENRTFKIEFFGSAFPDPSGFGEGQTFLEAVEVMTDANGDALIMELLDAFSLAEPWVTATATKLLGDVCTVFWGGNEPRDTSEFSDVDEDCNENNVPDLVETTPENPFGEAEAADECPDADILCHKIEYWGTTEKATSSLGLFLCDGTYSSFDVWYRYRPAWTGVAFVTTYTSPPMTLTVFDGCPESGGQVIACSSPPDDSVKFPVERLDEYWIRVAAPNLATDPFTIELIGPECCLNETDCNRNRIPEVCECLADVNGDGVVDGTDLILVQQNNGPCPAGDCPWDVDGDGEVDDDDFLIVLRAQGPCPFPEDPD